MILRPLGARRVIPVMEAGVTVMLWSVEEYRRPCGSRRGEDRWGASC